MSLIHFLDLNILALEIKISFQLEIRSRFLFSYSYANKNLLSTNTYLFNFVTLYHNTHRQKMERDRTLGTEPHLYIWNLRGVLLVFRLMLVQLHPRISGCEPSVM